MLGLLAVHAAVAQAALQGGQLPLQRLGSGVALPEPLPLLLQPLRGLLVLRPHLGHLALQARHGLLQPCTVTQA